MVWQYCEQSVCMCVCVLVLCPSCLLSGMSTYMPLRKEPPLISEANQKTPVFQAHGDMDTTVSILSTEGSTHAGSFHFLHSAYHG